MDASSVRIREPRPGEAAELASVQNHCWRQTYSGLLSERFYDAAALARRTANWERALADQQIGSPLSIGVAECVTGSVTGSTGEAGGELVGVALAGPARGEDVVREHQLYILYVLSEWHGSGAGQRLLDAVLADRAAQLMVAAENPRAIRFYQRNRFVADGAEVVDDDAEGLREIRMVR